MQKYMLLVYLRSAIVFSSPKAINHRQKIQFSSKLRISILFVAKPNIQENFTHTTSVLERDFFIWC